MFGDLLDFGGRLIDTVTAGDARKEQRQYDEKMANTFVQRRVQDAKKAGVSPLFALGAGGYSPSAVSVGSDFAGMGQGLGRAIDAVATGSERTTRRLEELAVERGELENAKLRADLSLSTQAGQGPSYPDGSTQRKPPSISTSIPGKPGVEPGLQPSISFHQRPDGSVGVVYGQGMKQTVEDSPYEWTEFGRNVLMTNIGKDEWKPPKSYLPKGKDDWEWSYLKQGWVPVKRFVGPPRNWDDYYSKGGR